MSEEAITFKERLRFSAKVKVSALFEPLLRQPTTVLLPILPLLVLPVACVVEAP